MKKNRNGRNRAHGSTTDEEERQDRIDLDGTVVEALPGTLFRIKCSTGHEVICTLSGRMRIHRIRLLPGDRILLAVSPYDLTRGRVTRRL
jgi:translation initiation factor IF-1